MDSIQQEEENLLLHDEEENVLLLGRPRKGGFRTIPFIIVNESLERLASVGLVPNMILFLMNEYHMDIAFVSTILALWSFLSSGLSIFGAILADSYLGRFKVIALGSFSSALGIALLWSTTMFPQLRPPPCEEFSSSCRLATLPQLFFLVSAFALISIGTGCNRPCSIVFGDDQLNNTGNPRNKTVLESYLNWYMITTSVAALFSVIVIVYIQDRFGWKIGFGVPAVLMALSVIVILLGSPWYIKKEPTPSVFTPIFQVLVAAFKKRSIEFPPVHEGNSVIYRKKLFAPSENLRCLNKACLITDPARDLNPDGLASDPWSLCTVEQVETLKALLRISPMWSTGLVLILCMDQCSFGTLQAETMDRHLTRNFEIPPGCFGVLTIVGIVLSLIVYDRVVIPLSSLWTGNSHGFSVESRMAFSLVLSTSAVAVAAAVEIVRRRMAVEQGLIDDPNGQVAMSALWLLPQYLLLGCAEGLSMTAQTKFFLVRLPKTMSSIAGALYLLELGVASLIGVLLVTVVNWVSAIGENTSWLENDINRGHIGYYYVLVALIGTANIFYYFFILDVFGGSEDEMLTLLNESEGGDEVSH